MMKLIAQYDRDEITALITKDLEAKGYSVAHFAAVPQGENPLFTVTVEPIPLEIAPPQTVVKKRPTGKTPEQIEAGIKRMQDGKARKKAGIPAAPSTNGHHHEEAVAEVVAATGGPFPG